MRWLGERHFSQPPRQPGFVQNPYACYADLQRRGGPLFWQEFGLWCLCDYQSVDHALRDRRLARLPPSGEQPRWPEHLHSFAASERYSLLALEPPAHTRLRKVVNGAFIARRVRPLAEMIATLCHAAIDSFSDRLHRGDSVDLIASFATPVPVIVIARLLGMPEAEGPQLLAWSHAMVRIYTGQQSLAEERAANTAAADFSARLQQVIDARRTDPGDDLMSHMLGNGLSDAEIISLAILLLNAGHEATVHQIGNAVRAMLLQPAALREQLHDDARADRLVVEALRHDAPLHLFTRYAQVDITLADGVTLAAGEQLALLLGAANHDPARFSQPHRFDPTRENAEHVSLGAGIHFCVGAALARLELRIALRTLFERLPTLALAEVPVYRDNYHFHGLEQLNVSLSG